MTQTSDTIQTFLSGIPPFKQLSPAQLQQLSNKLQVRRYGMGQAILPLQESPPYIAIIYTGKARLIGNNSHSDIPVTLYKLKPGEIIGWKSLLQGIPCEKVMACEEETLCLVLASEEFLTLLEEEPILKAWFAVETRSYSIREAALTSVYASVQESINSPIPNPRSPFPKQKISPQTRLFAQCYSRLFTDGESIFWDAISQGKYS